MTDFAVKGCPADSRIREHLPARRLQAAAFRQSMPIDALARGPYGPPPLSTLPGTFLRTRTRTITPKHRRCQKKTSSQVPSMPLTDLIAPNAILPALKVN